MSGLLDHWGEGVGDDGDGDDESDEEDEAGGQNLLDVLHSDSLVLHHVISTKNSLSEWPAVSHPQASVLGVEMVSR